MLTLQPFKGANDLFTTSRLKTSKVYGWGAGFSKPLSTLHVSSIDERSCEYKHVMTMQQQWDLILMRHTLRQQSWSGTVVYMSTRLNMESSEDIQTLDSCWFEEWNVCRSQGSNVSFFGRCSPLRTIAIDESKASKAKFCVTSRPLNLQVPELRCLSANATHRTSNTLFDCFNF